MKWVLADHDASAVSRLAAEEGLHPVIARLLAVRGITGAEAARAFLSAELGSLSDPFLFSGMERSVERVRRALSRRERIVVYGDYDVDGVTGSAVLFLALRSLGGDPVSYLPDRMTEGYGLNDGALRRLAADGARVVVTVDCGISALREAGAARDLGIDLIITDHHESAAVHGGFDPGTEAALPDAFSVIHPGLLAPGADAAVRERVSVLTGAGVAFKFSQGLLGTAPDDPRLVRLLDLVTLGTVADMGGITGENRVLVKHGLKLLSAPQGSLRPGIAALKSVAGLADRRVTAGTVGFSLAPRINASGRLGRADAAFRMLTTDDASEALTLAAELDKVNRERQAVEECIWEEAREQCLREDLASTGAFILASDAWHPGVIGIVASRIVEEFYRPAALISLQNGTGKGSARSIPGFDLYQGLERCRDLLLGFGGHKYAAGLTVAADRVPLLRERLSSLVLERFAEDGFVRTLRIDGPLAFEDLTFDLLNDIERIAPFGQGNPEPRFGAKRLEVLSLRPVGEGRHLKMRLRQPNGAAFDAIAFGRGGPLFNGIRCGSVIAAVFTPRLNTWNGLTSIQLEIKDIKVEASTNIEARNAK